MGVQQMSKTFGHDSKWSTAFKRGIKEGCKSASRNETRVKLNIIIRDPELADEIFFERYQDTDDIWNYD
jgi:hypothetical protein